MAVLVPMVQEPELSEPEPLVTESLKYEPLESASPKHDRRFCLLEQNCPTAFLKQYADDVLP